jgi:hypothetical protein
VEHQEDPFLARRKDSPEEDTDFPSHVDDSDDDVNHDKVPVFVPAISGALPEGKTASDYTPSTTSFLPAARAKRASPRCRNCGWERTNPEMMKYHPGLSGHLGRKIVQPADVCIVPEHLREPNFPAKKGKKLPAKKKVRSNP